MSKIIFINIIVKEDTKDVFRNSMNVLFIVDLIDKYSLGYRLYRYNIRV